MYTSLIKNTKKNSLTFPLFSQKSKISKGQKWDKIDELTKKKKNLWLLLEVKREKRWSFFSSKLEAMIIFFFSKM